jgi:uncharacterized heparinase superfamily protein
VCYAAFDAGSEVGSGAGPQMYAEKTVGYGSRSPFEIMMPSGSAGSTISSFFFIPALKGNGSANAQREANQGTDDAILGRLFKLLLRQELALKDDLCLG